MKNKKKEPIRWVTGIPLWNWKIQFRSNGNIEEAFLAGCDTPAVHTHLCEIINSTCGFDRVVSITKKPLSGDFVDKTYPVDVNMISSAY